MIAGMKTPRAGGPRGAKSADREAISGANGCTHVAALVKRLIVGAALRGYLPAKLATRLIGVLGLREV